MGEFSAVAVKTRSFSLNLRLKDVLTKKDLPFVFSASIDLCVDASDPDSVKDFGGLFLGSETEVNTVVILTPSTSSIVPV